MHIEGNDITENETSEKLLSAVFLIRRPKYIKQIHIDIGYGHFNCKLVLLRFRYPHKYPTILYMNIHFGLLKVTQQFVKLSYASEISKYSFKAE